MSSLFRRLVRWALLLVIVLLAVPAGAWTWYANWRADTVAAMERECSLDHVPFSVVERLITSESSWRWWIVNPTDPSRGLAQITDANAHDPEFIREFAHGKRIDQDNPIQSAVIAVRYLAWLHTKLAYKDWYWTTLAYKAGLGDPERGYITEPRRWQAIPIEIRRIAWEVAHGR